MLVEERVGEEEDREGCEGAGQEAWQEDFGGV